MSVIIHLIGPYWIDIGLGLQLKCTMCLWIHTGVDGFFSHRIGKRGERKIRAQTVPYLAYLSVHSLLPKYCK